MLKNVNTVQLAENISNKKFFQAYKFRKTKERPENAKKDKFEISSLFFTLKKLVRYSFLLFSNFFLFRRDNIFHVF